MRHHDWLRRAALRSPDAIAVSDGRVAMSFATLDQRASEVAGRLLGQGIEPGSSALLNLGEGLEKVIQIHALIRLGVSITPVEGDLPADGIEQSIEASRPDHRLGPGDGMGGGEGPSLDRAAEGASPVLCRILTGGSTGKPKAVALTRENHLMSAAGSALNLGLRSDDLWLCPLSLAHVSGLTILIRSVIYGTGFVLADRFSTESVVDSIADQGVNAISLVPTMLARLLEAGPVPSGLRFALIGGGPVPADLIREAHRAGLPAVPTYGLTEACSQVATSNPAEAAREPAAAGPALPLTEVRVVDGEIEVSGPTLSPEAVSEDGWLRTGDLGRLDEDGRLFVEGRLDRLILSGGEKVHPAEVEAALLGHPAVAEAFVLGVPDPEWQQAVVAVIVPVPGSEPAGEEVRDACRSVLPGFKLPKRIVFTDRIPLTSAGKPDPEALRELVDGTTP
jgi:O-succinylbenzoic acid--CoA ligase